MGLAGAQAHLKVGSVDDPREREADSMAARALAKPSCSCGGTCDECKGKIQRSPARTRSTVPALLGSSGQGFHGPLRSRMEGRFKRDLSDVRVHTGKAAAASAKTLGAEAYTLGSDIVFDEGAYQPGTSQGDRLIAHELAHVVQQGGADQVQRTVSGDITAMSITPSFAAALTDDELQEQKLVIGRHINTLSPVTLEYQSALDNEQILNQEAERRLGDRLGVTLEPDSSVPRPAGLPSDGYVLHGLDGLPQAFIDALPEGEVVTLNPNMMGQAPQSPTLGDDLTQGAFTGGGGGAWAGLNGANTALSTYGFAAAGDFSIGMVAIPPANMSPAPWSQFNPIDLAAPLDRAGHTAVFVREGGKITLVRGFNPQMSTPSTFLDVAKNQGEIFSGQRGVPAEITSDAYLFESTAARTLEYPVTPDVAARFAQGLPEPGPVGAGQPPMYSAPPSTYAAKTGTQVGCVGSNCGLWAAQQAEPQLGGRFGVQGQTPVMDIGPDGTVVQGMARQGKIYGMMGDVQSGAPANTMPNATGPAVAGEMSTGLKVLKWGGRVMLVVGIGATIWSIYSAPEGQKARAAVTGISGLVGGFVAGAALGLACGPAAPVCCIVTGIIGGIVGGIVSSGIAGAIYDWFTSPPPPPQPWYGPRMVDHNGIVCPDCHSLSQPLGTYDARIKPDFEPMFGSQRDLGGFGGLGGSPMNRTLTDSEMKMLRSYLEMEGTSSGSPKR